MSRKVLTVLAAIVLTSAAHLLAQESNLTTSFRQGNESAAQSKWADAISAYETLARTNTASPALYWNWSQVASAQGVKGEALWAMLRARDLSPSDPTMSREVERLRAELGLDPSEISLGLLGESRTVARRYRFDLFAIAAFLIAGLLSLGKKPRLIASHAAFLIGILLALPLWGGLWREPRGVVVHKESPLVDAPKTDAVSLSSLREGEVVPILEDQGEYFRIQDASGARGYALKSDVRKIGLD